jgi:alpha-N-arabinofuranosidase
MRDAVIAAASLNIFNRHADRVRGANIAQMVNVLQAMILTRGDQMLLTPTYHVFEMYTVHHDAVLLPSTTTATSWFVSGADSIPAVSASASRDRNGVMHVTLANLDPARARPVSIELRGARVAGVSGRVLTGPTMMSYNSFEQPTAVTPAAFTGASVASGAISVTLPAHSVVVLEVR